MTIGGSLFLIALGAILRYAVTDRIEGVDLSTAGLILMVVGALAFAIALYMTFVRRDRYAVRDRYVDEPVDRRY
jgi:Domain of unknown function (DUF6458)